MDLSPLANLTTPIFPTAPALAHLPALVLVSTVEDTTWTLALWVCRRGPSPDFEGDRYLCWEVSKSRTGIINAAKGMPEADVVPYLTKAFDNDDVTLRKFKTLEQANVEIVFGPSSKTPLAMTLTRVGVESAPTTSLLEVVSNASNEAKRLRKSVDGASQLKALEREVASLRASRGALQSELDRLKNDKAAASGNAAGSWTAASGSGLRPVNTAPPAQNMTRNLGQPNRKRRIRSAPGFDSSSDE